MASFQTTPEAILDSARNIFVSENFAGAISVMRDCFSDDNVNDETIFALLRGDIGLKSAEDGFVDISEEYADEEHKQLASEILANYDFLIRENDKVFQVNAVMHLNLDTIQSTNSLVTSLKENKGKLVNIRSHSISAAIADIESKYGSQSYYFSDKKHQYAVFTDNKIFFFAAYENPIFTEVCTFYEYPSAAALAYQAMWE